MANKPIFDTDAFTQLTDKDKDKHKEVMFSTTQKVQQVQEEQKVQQVQYGTTQGKKGQKMPRINLAFSTENHDFLRMESRKQGMSITAFINHIVEQYRQQDNN